VPMGLTPNQFFFKIDLYEKNLYSRILRTLYDFFLLFQVYKKIDPTHIHACEYFFLIDQFYKKIDFGLGLSPHATRDCLLYIQIFTKHHDDRFHPHTYML